MEVEHTKKEIVINSSLTITVILYSHSEDHINLIPESTKIESLTGREVKLLEKNETILLIKNGDLILSFIRLNTIANPKECGFAIDDINILPILIMEEYYYRNVEENINTLMYMDFINDDLLGIEKITYQVLVLYLKELKDSVSLYYDIKSNQWQWFVFRKFIIKYSQICNLVGFNIIPSNIDQQLLTSRNLSSNRTVYELFNITDRERGFLLYMLI